MSKRQLMLFLSTLVAVSAVWALAPVSDETRDIYSRSAKLMSRQLPRMHLTHTVWGDRIATNGLNIFLNSLDYDHSFFLASDVRGFRMRADKLDNELRDGVVAFAFEVYDVLLERVSNRVAYVDTVLERGFDLTKEENYTWKRKTAPWPADKQARDEIWHGKIKNQYVSQIVNRQLKEESASEESPGKTRDTEAAGADQADQESEAGSRKKNVTAELTPEENIRKQYHRYLETLRDNDAHWLLALYLTSFARAYDPHSDYLSVNNREDFDIDMSLSLVGIGALLTREDGAAKVVRLIPGGPAEQDGRLQPGDKIIAVAQGAEEAVDIMHWPLSKSVRLIRGEKGTKVVLSIIPASDISGVAVEKIGLVRDEVKLDEKAAKGSIRKIKGENSAERTLGVIGIPDFYADISGRERGRKETRSVTRDVRELIADLRTNDIEGIVLDLRNNGGGALTEAVDMTGLFIKHGPVVQVRSSRGRQVLTDTDPAQVYDGPLVVLVNRQSASASEILAGALKDYGRAVIVGDTKTHGKGTVQSLVDVDRRERELGSLKLTTAGFYRISGKSTQRAGIRTDIAIPSMLDHMDIGEEYLPGALPFSVILPVRYRENVNLALQLPLLKDLSHERCANDPDFVAYAELIDHLAEERRSSTISLNLEDRLELAREKKKMAEFLDDDSTQGEEDDEEDDQGQDLVLHEALHILGDLIMLEEKQEVSVSGEEEKHALDSIADVGIRSGGQTRRIP